MQEQTLNETVAFPHTKLQSELIIGSNRDTCETARACNVQYEWMACCWRCRYRRAFRKLLSSRCSRRRHKQEFVQVIVHWTGEAQMPKNNSSLISYLRTLIANEQDWLCHYCEYPMWEPKTESPTEFAQRHRLTKRQSKQMRCTVEHLHAKSDGGSDQRVNLVAACTFCNRRRHRRAFPLNPKDYRGHVRQRVSAGRWHTFRPHLRGNRRQADRPRYLREKNHKSQ